MLQQVGRQGVQEARRTKPGGRDTPYRSARFTLRVGRLDDDQHRLADANHRAGRRGSPGTSRHPIRVASSPYVGRLRPDRGWVAGEICAVKKRVFSLCV